MADFDKVIFGTKKYSDVLKDIYTRNVKKEQELLGLISQLRNLIATIQDAVTVVPLIAEYMNLSIKNDDNLIKMAAIVQKALDRGEDTGDFLFTDDEKAKLLEHADSVTKQMLSTPVKAKA